VPVTPRNLKEPLEDVDSNFDGAPDLEFRHATKALELETTSLVIRVGTHLPSAATSMGRVLLAGWRPLLPTAAAIEADLASESAHARAR
jgi:hypothetical protein